MRAEDLDFILPQELIAQSPLADRSASRLLHYRRADRAIEHRQFAHLPSLLRPGDLLVFNDARVAPARFALRKATGGVVEGLFLGEIRPGVWRVLLRDLGRSDKPMHMIGRDDIAVSVIRRLGQGECEIAVESAEPALAILAGAGRMPLPPYIRRRKIADPLDEADRVRYQTVYAASPGAVAAPTAGLHFTQELLGELAAAGVQRTFVTLHVGVGTFKPISADRLEDHVMHCERYTLPAQAADAINGARAEGRRVIAVGTTAARVLESQPAGLPLTPRSAETSIFIYPPYQWRFVDALITNFHLPRSTLIALVAAMVGLDQQRRIYHEAIEARYRFFSYGDAMLIE